MVDLGTGSGLLAMMAATAGADTVVACDLHESLCNVARQVSPCPCYCKIMLASAVRCIRAAHILHFQPKCGTFRSYVALLTQMLHF